MNTLLLLHHRRIPRDAVRLLTAAAAWLLLAAARAQDAGPVPDWSLETTRGEMVHFHAVARQAPTVMVFWTSWCPHCRTLLPALQSVHDEFAPRGVRFFALDIWEDGDAVAYFRDHGLTIPLILTADLVAEDFGVRHTPAVFVTDTALRRRTLDAAERTPDAFAAALRAELRRQLGDDTRR